MERFRNTLFIVAVAAAVLGGVYLIGRINSDNSIDTSSANVYNVLGLSQIEDNIIYPDKIVIDVNAQILDMQKITEGTVEVEFDKNILEVEDIVMPSSIIALNQKIDTSEGKITLQISTKSTEGLKGVSTIAKIVFNKLQSSGKFTSVSILPSSTLGNPNTLDSVEKSISVSF